MSSPGVVPQVGEGAPKKNEVVAASGEATPSSPRRNLLVRCLSVLGLAFLAYLVGAAVMYFQLPTYDFLLRAFGGAEAWYRRSQTSQLPAERGPLTVGKIDKPDKTCDGFNLFMYGGNSRAVLVDMRGEPVHHWHAPFSEVWPDPPHLRGPIDDALVYFNDGHVYPNGDLVVVIEGPIDLRHSSNGYGLAKLDKDSHVLWRYPGKCHHDLDVGDDGVIYAISNEVVEKAPQGLEYLPTPYMPDQLDFLKGDQRARP